MSTDTEKEADSVSAPRRKRPIEHKTKLKKLEDPNVNPCIEEANASFECLEINMYERGKCEEYFDNYNNCKKFWGSVKSARRRQGIKPALPSPEERQRILQDFSEGKFS